MTPQEIRKLQPGNLILIGDMEALVQRVTFVPDHHREFNNEVSMFIYEGSYKWSEKMADGGFGWITTDNEEFNTEHRLMAMSNLHGIPIPEKFEKINGVNLYNDPKAVEIYEFVHLYQNEWNRLEDRVVDWKLNKS